MGETLAAWTGDAEAVAGAVEAPADFGAASWLPPAVARRPAHTISGAMST